MNFPTSSRSSIGPAFWREFQQLENLRRLQRRLEETIVDIECVGDALRILPHVRSLLRKTEALVEQREPILNKFDAGRARKKKRFQ